MKATEDEERQGQYVYTFEYDDMGNRILYQKTRNGVVQESAEYTYNLANQLTAARLYDGKHYKNVEYTYDADGNRILQEEVKLLTRKVELSFEYTVENRLKAVSDKNDLLVAMAYDGDGNRIFQLNYNLHTDDDWKGNSGNGNGNNKDNSGSGNSGNASGNGTGSSSSENNGNSGSNENGNSENNGNGGNGNHYGWDNGSSGNNGNDNSGDNGNTSTGGVNDNNGNANGNTNNTGGSQNQSGILFPINGEVSELEQELIDMIKTTGKEKDYELTEYVNDVNREHTEVLMELNINGIMDTAYSYGNERLTNERFTGWTGYYTYDPRGSVSGVTDSEGMIWQSYRYNANGDFTFGRPQYNNVYGYNAESYNPNMESQYLRSRYYNVPNGNFLTEDSYLGKISDPLTLNRYNYVKSSPLNYTDPTGKMAVETLRLINFLHQSSLINNDQTAFLILAINLFKLDVQLLKDIKDKMEEWTGVDLDITKDIEEEMKHKNATVQSAYVAFHEIGQVLAAKELKKTGVNSGLAKPDITNPYPEVEVLSGLSDFKGEIDIKWFEYVWEVKPGYRQENFTKS